MCGAIRPTVMNLIHCTSSPRDHTPSPLTLSCALRVCNALTHTRHRDTTYTYACTHIRMHTAADHHVSDTLNPGVYVHRAFPIALLAACTQFWSLSPSSPDWPLPLKPTHTAPQYLTPILHFSFLSIPFAVRLCHHFFTSTRVLGGASVCVCMPPTLGSTDKKGEVLAPITPQQWDTPDCFLLRRGGRSMSVC